MEAILSVGAQRSAGILILTIVGIESGGLYLLRVHRGGMQISDLQKTFHRAGHAHAGVLVILSLVTLAYVDLSGVANPWGQLARSAIPLSAILIPGGFFFSTLSPKASKPNRWVRLIPLGAASLALGLISLGIGLLG